MIDWESDIHIIFLKEKNILSEHSSPKYNIIGDIYSQITIVFFVCLESKMDVSPRRKEQAAAADAGSNKAGRGNKASV